MVVGVTAQGVLLCSAVSAELRLTYPWNLVDIGAWKLVKVAVVVRSGGFNSRQHVTQGHDEWGCFPSDLECDAVGKLFQQLSRLYPHIS